MTVAAIVEDDARFLVVEEMADGHRVFNQPAGHLEPDESLANAVVREVLEETRAHFQPRSLVGVYRWLNPATGETHMRVTFSGTLNGSDPARPLDEPIIEPHWLRYDELRALDGELRSPLVLTCIDDYLRGCHYPLELLRDLG